MSDFLATLAESSARRVAAARARVSLAQVQRDAGARAPARRLALAQAGFDVIAEVKFASPSSGVLSAGTARAVEAVERARAYAAGGACAISVLTEPMRFRGALEHLRRVAEVSAVPVMRKDFLVDPYQVWEARAAGADGVLLIVRMLDDAGLRRMLAASAEAGVFALVEAFRAEELARVASLLAAEPPAADVLIGVNGRDLVTLDVDLGRSERLAGLLPAGYHAVAESGLLRARDARRVACAGFRLALVGTALMRSQDPAAAVRAFLAEGRALHEERACPSA